jgi:hypothetical protein
LHSLDSGLQKCEISLSGTWTSRFNPRTSGGDWITTHVGRYTSGGNRDMNLVRFVTAFGAAGDDWKSPDIYGTTHLPTGAVYCSRAFCWALAAFQFLHLFTQSVGLLGRGISPRKEPAHKGQHKHRINAHRHPCAKWGSNPWSQCLSGRRQFMP